MDFLIFFKNSIDVVCLSLSGWVMGPIWKVISDPPVFSVPTEIHCNSRSKLEFVLSFVCYSKRIVCRPREKIWKGLLSFQWKFSAPVLLRTRWCLDVREGNGRFHWSFPPLSEQLFLRGGENWWIFIQLTLQNPQTIIFWDLPIGGIFTWTRLLLLTFLNSIVEAES